MCNDLTEITIGRSVQTIGEFAFASNYYPTNVTSLALIPPSCKYSFDSNAYWSGILYVPNVSLSAYMNADCWKEFNNVQGIEGEIPGDVNGDGTLNIGDVTSIINLMLNGDEIPAYCDVNGDGNVTISDVTILTGLLLNGN
jgi:hypothetical protein